MRGFEALAGRPMLLAGEAIDRLGWFLAKSPCTRQSGRQPIHQSLDQIRSLPNEVLQPRQ